MALQTAGDILGKGAFAQVLDFKDVIVENYTQGFSDYEKETFHMKSSEPIFIYCKNLISNAFETIEFSYNELSNGVAIAAKQFINTGNSDEENKEHYYKEELAINSLIKLNMVEFNERTFVRIREYLLISKPGWQCLLYKKYAADTFTAYNNTKYHISETNVRQVLRNIHKLENLVKSFLIKFHEKHWCHRDIKLENILCSKSNLLEPDCEFAVSDFGFAIRTGEDVSDSGTPDYMSPYISRPNASFFLNNFPKLTTFDKEETVALKKKIYNRWNVWMKKQSDIISDKYDRKLYVITARRYTDFYAMHMTFFRLYDDILSRFANVESRYYNEILSLLHENRIYLFSFAYDSDDYQLQQGGSRKLPKICFASTNRTYFVRLDKTNKKKYICMKLENSTKRTEKVYLSTIKGKYKYISK